MNGATDPSQLFQSIDQIDFVKIGVIFVLSWLLINLIERYLPPVGERLPGSMRLYIVSSVPMVKLLIMILAFLLIFFQIITPTVQNLAAILAAMGLVIGFAFKDYISSLIAGIVTIYERPYKPGDWIGINGVYGEVKKIGLRALSLVTPDDTVVVIPHLTIWNTSIHNANAGQRDLQCVADFYLHPDHDAALVRQKLREVALTSPFVQLDRPVSVVVAEKPWGTHYRLKAYPIDSRDQFQFTSDLTVRGKQALALESVKAAAVLPVTGDSSGW